jgi:2'-5' RNA ligase
MRLFVAASPSGELRQGLAGVVRSLRALRPPPPDAKWVRIENLHLTFAFLGEASAAQLDLATVSLRDALTGRPAVEARTAALGAFPDRGPVRVVWLAVEPESGLGGLAAAVRDALRSAGLPFDAKPFRAHLTLARARRPWPDAIRPRLAAAAPEPLPFPVREVALVESRLGPAGPTYTARARFPLVEEAA